jgi:hypothetical protein
MSGDLFGELAEHEGSSLIRFAKLIGHLGPRTLFSTYIHTFDIIQAHTMKRLAAIHGSRKLNGKTIAAIVSGMRSRATQARLPDKTIQEVLSYSALRKNVPE